MANDDALEINIGCTFPGLIQRPIRIGGSLEWPDRSHLPETAVATTQTDSRTPDLQPLLLRMPSVVRLTGLGRSTIYRLMATEAFPRPVRLSARAVAWRREEVTRWSEARTPATH